MTKFVTFELCRREHVREQAQKFQKKYPKDRKDRDGEE
jgi:hypothetical protein